MAQWLGRCFWTGRLWVRILFQPPRQGFWANPSLTVAYRASVCKLQRSVNCCGREHLWVVVDLKGTIEISGMIEYHFPIVCGLWDNREGLVFMYETMNLCMYMHECMYISVYV